jgi:pyrroline-5-carboxylate reductase
LAGSVIRGLLRAKYCAPGAIIAGEPNDELRASVQNETGIAVTPDNLEVARSAETILIGVKPTYVLAVVREIAPVTDGKLVISLAAGVRVRNMESMSNARLLRVMTNTPTAIGCGATAVARGARTTPDDLARARSIFDAIGVTVEVSEEQIDAVTALSGSGPAFVYTVIEALADGGIKTGLPPEVAAVLATHTVLGAAQLAAETGQSPEELRRMVVTPGGTTAAGLAAMEKLKTSEGLIAAVEAAAARAHEMAAQTVA